MTEKELIRRALMGDREAQRKCTNRGTILPCPLCGSKAAIQQDITGKKSYHVVCNNVKDMCPLIAGLPMWRKSEEDALTDWNTRPALPIGRCKECKYYTVLWHCEVHSQEPDQYGSGVYVEMLPDDFCSYFEPKEEK